LNKKHIRGLLKTVSVYVLQNVKWLFVRRQNAPQNAPTKSHIKIKNAQGSYTRRLLSPIG